MTDMEPERGHSPFRSLGEQVRERIRRIDEETEVVSAENARLLADIARSTRRVSGSTSLLAFGVAITLAGCGIGTLYADDRADARASERDRVVMKTSGEELAVERACDEARADAAGMLATCKSLAWRAGGPPSADCQAGDPLCEPEPVFDREAAAAALSKIEGQAASCLRPPRSLHVHATVNVATDGTASSAHLDQPADLTLAEQSCISAKLRTLRVPYFGSGPLTIGRTLSWEAP